MGDVIEFIRLCPIYKEPICLLNVGMPLEFWENNLCEVQIDGAPADS